jgi:hypothetical protein
MPQIPIRKRGGHIRAYAIVDEDTFSDLSKRRWSGRKAQTKSPKWYAQTRHDLPCGRSTMVTMHALVMGPRPSGMVIDHINGNSLDNRRCNLRFATPGQNSQNRLPANSNTYIGVVKAGKKWVAVCGGRILPVTSEKRDAALSYDKLAVEMFGIHARTNGLLTETEKLEIIQRGPTSFLPRGVYMKDGNFKARGFSERTYKSAQEASLAYEKRSQERKMTKARSVSQKEITRNADGVAVIELKNKAGSVIERCLVDDQDWHELCCFSWSLTKKCYCAAHIDGKKIRMHIHILKAKFIDHVNGNGLDNRRSNLRMLGFAGNAQNKAVPSTASSRYLGVTREKNGTFIARTNVNGKLKHLGVFDEEVDAARAYNEFVLTIYDKPKLNDVPDLPEGVTTESLRRTAASLRNAKPEPEDVALAKKFKGLHPRRKNCCGALLDTSEATLSLGDYRSVVQAAQAYNEAALILSPKTELNDVPKPPDGVRALSDKAYAKVMRILEKKNTS